MIQPMLINFQNSNSQTSIKTKLSFFSKKNGYFNFLIFFQILNFFSKKMFAGILQAYCRQYAGKLRKTIFWKKKIKNLKILMSLYFFE